MSDHQKAHFDTFGFVVVHELFSAAETAVISSEFDALMLEERDGQPFAGAERQIVEDWYRRRPAANYIEHDRRIRDPIGELLGPQAELKDHNDGN